MKTHKDKCPSVFEFESYLTSSMTNNDRLLFEEHTKKCTLCNEALEGFRTQKIVSVQPIVNHTKKLVFKQKKNIALSPRVLQIAASVVLFIGLAVSVKLMLDKLNFNNLTGGANFENIETLQQKGLKKLTSKSTNQYIYLGKENAILVNDELVSLSDLQSANVVTPNTKQLIVQVESDNYESSQKLISTIKDRHQIPVFAFRSIKK